MFTRMSLRYTYLAIPNNCKSGEYMGGILGKLGTWSTTFMTNKLTNMLVPSNDSEMGGREPIARR